MKRLILLVLFIVTFATFWTIDYCLYDGEFTKWSHTTVGLEHYKDGRIFYLAYHLKWDGFGDPALEKVEFIKRDGTIIAKDDDEFVIKPFISKAGHITGSDEAEVLAEGLNKELFEVKGYPADKDLYLVLSVGYRGNNPENDINVTRITYKKFGVTQHQDIPFDEGVITDPVED
ncbi:hypothetical protein [Mesobacillus jeotgali]|uniref:hypothetical protein n=1 Tax=Mesobacillus jeotgali TaxID=129985 RepID=UPI0009A7ECEB|nr:hypothetical protein [Mesobacillus jeotgali]